MRGSQLLRDRLAPIFALSFDPGHFVFADLPARHGLFIVGDTA